LHETIVTKSGFFVMEMSKNSPTSICSSKKILRLASARHIREGRERIGRGEGRGEEGRGWERGRRKGGEGERESKKLAPLNSKT
jgi:hypothetical protein